MCGSFNTAKVYNKMTEVPDLGLRQKKPLWLFKFFISHFFITLMKVIEVCAMAGIQGFLINQCFIIVIVLPHRDREKKTNSPPTPEKFKDFREPTHSSLAGNFLVAQGMCKNVQNLFTDYCYGILQGVIPGI